MMEWLSRTSPNSSDVWLHNAPLFERLESKCRERERVEKKQIRTEREQKKETRAEKNITILLRNNSMSRSPSCPFSLWKPFTVHFMRLIFNSNINIINFQLHEQFSFDRKENRPKFIRCGVFGAQWITSINLIIFHFRWFFFFFDRRPLIVSD